MGLYLSSCPEDTREVSFLARVRIFSSCIVKWFEENNFVLRFTWFAKKSNNRTSLCRRGSGG